MLKSNDKQELFDAAMNGVIAQGKPSWSKESDNCMYKMCDNNGYTLLCGVGHCLTDEGLTFAANVVDDVVALVNEYNDEVENLEIDSKMMEFLMEMQSAHDNAVVSSINGRTDFILKFIKNMKIIAKDWKLKTGHI